MRAMAVDANALRAELTQAQEQIARMAMEIDQVRQGSATLQAVQRLEVMIQTMTSATATKTSILNLKTWEPKKFRGDKDEEYKDWAKTVKVWTNNKIDGFKDALEWAEDHKEEIDQPARVMCQWLRIEEANRVLYIFLEAMTEGGALSIVEQCKNEGFEAWRRLAKRYKPSSGTLDLNKFQGMLTRGECKSIEELPAALDGLLKDLRFYEKRGQGKFPNDLKIALLRVMLPKAYRKDIEFKHIVGNDDFDQIVEKVMSYANEARVLGIRERGPKAMDLDYTQAEEARAWTDEEWAEYTEELCYMATKGKGKGKGKYGAWKGKGKGKGDGKVADTRVCFWCQKPGHVQAICKDKLAGKPKVPRPQSRSAANVEEQADWVEDMKGLTEECGCLGCGDEDSDDGSDYEAQDTADSVCGDVPEDVISEVGEIAEVVDVLGDSESEDDGRDAWTEVTAKRNRFRPDSAVRPPNPRAQDPRATEVSLEVPRQVPLEVPQQESFGEAIRRQQDELKKSHEVSLEVPRQESFGEAIRREQVELKKKLQKIVETEKSQEVQEDSEDSREAPAEVPEEVKEFSEDQSEEKESPERVPKPPELLEPMKVRVRNRNRNQSAKKKRICVLQEGPSAASSSPTSSSSCSSEGCLRCPAPAKEIEVQTDLSLAHTMRDVMWTPSCLAPVIEDASEGEDEEDRTEDGTDAADGMSGICEGSGAECVDNLEDTRPHVDTALPDTAIIMITIMIAIMMIMMIMMMATKMMAQAQTQGDVTHRTIQIANLERNGAKVRKYKLRKGMTTDSGAGNNVMPRRMVRKKGSIRPSAGSQAGLRYVSANNGRIDNEGEVDFAFTTNEGNEESFVMQIAEVNKALLAISYLVDKGYRVTYDKDDKGRDTSHMLHKKSGKIARFRRDNNVWVLDVFVNEPAESEASPFVRQG